MSNLHLISIILEAVIALLALITAFKGKKYMYGMAITFGIYVLYDYSKLYSWSIPSDVLTILFFIGTVTAFMAMLGIYKRS